MVDVAVRRWERYTGKTAVLDATGQTLEDVEVARMAANDSAIAAEEVGMNAVHRAFRDPPPRGDGHQPTRPKAMQTATLQLVWRSPNRHRCCGYR